MNRLTLLGAALALSALAGCAEPPSMTSEGGIRVQDETSSATLYSVVMPDGTRCVALIGYQKGAVDCDFSEPQP